MQLARLLRKIFKFVESVSQPAQGLAQQNPKRSSGGGAGCRRDAGQAFGEEAEGRPENEGKVGGFVPSARYGASDVLHVEQAAIATIQCTSKAPPNTKKPWLDTSDWTQY